RWTFMSSSSKTSAVPNAGPVPLFVARDVLGSTFDARSSGSRTRSCTRLLHNFDVLCLLGPAALHDDGQLRPLNLRPKALALLARLALVEASQDHDVLAELLFPDTANTPESLRWHLSQRRASLPSHRASRH